MIRFGICGCGGFMERGVLPLVTKVDGVKVTAAFDQDAARMNKVGDQFGISRRYGSAEELIQSPEIDIVYIASPNAFHKDQTLAAAKAGKHVFCQKPMGINAGECRQMVDACRAGGVKLGIGFCYPFAGAQQKAREMIRQGAIGKVSYYSISYSLGGYNKDTVGWRCDPKLSGGGPLMDIAPHLVNLGCFLLDDKVQSVMSYVRPDLTAKDIELDAVALFEFTGGARGLIDTSFVRSHMHTYSIIGTGGSIRAVGTMCWRISGSLFLEADGKTRDVPFDMTEGIEEEIRQFVQAIEQNREVPMPGQAGLHAQAVIDAIYKSARSGKRCLIKD